MVTFCKVQKGMVIGGHYEIVEFLGRGAMGTVYKVKDNYFVEYNRIVACKILPKELRQTPGREEYFKREFLAAQELVHQNICCTYEFGEDRELETYYLIMEYVNGRTLRDLINKKEFALADALPIIEQIAAGLDFAHKRGILHLDMKPDNLIVSNSNQIKIMDFGLARVINNSMTHISLLDVEGTPLYMSPEQIDPKAARKRVDYAVDRWALGVIVYEMLAGFPPFDGRMGITPLIFSILNANPDILPVPSGVWQAILKMLSKDPKDRFSTCIDFFRELANPSTSNNCVPPCQENKTARTKKEEITSAIPLEQPQNEKQVSSTSDVHSAVSESQYLGVVEKIAEVDVSPCAATTFLKSEDVTGQSSIISLGEGPEELEADEDGDVQGQTASVISLGEAPEELEIEGLALACHTSLPDQMPPHSRNQSQSKKTSLYCETNALQPVKSKVGTSRTFRDMLPAFIWDQVKHQYPNQDEVERASRSKGFQFTRVNSYQYLVYRHRETSMDFVLIPSGSFCMGTQTTEGKDDERPYHHVFLDAYLMGMMLITQEIWQKVMGQNPAGFKKSGKYPVEQISWYDLYEFCQKTSLQIPTEAQWERACRANTDTIFYWGNEIDDAHCWYSENSGRSTHPVGEKKPNPFGLYDMCGNVWEWCLDDYHEYAYQCHSERNPIYREEKNVSLKKVRRGGSWLNPAEGCRCAVRQSDLPQRHATGLGARACFTLAVLP